MFTGIIETVGTVTRLQRVGQAARLAVSLDAAAEGVRPGDSIAVNGACLTVTRLAAAIAEFDVSRETLERSTLGDLRSGDAVNLERALRVGDRLGGHFVLGHVDGVGVLTRVASAPEQTTLEITAPHDLIARLIPKGSVAVHGISLTIADLHSDRFTIAVIPHTLEHTTLRRAASGDRVNLELDVLGKYVERLLTRGAAAPDASGLSEGFLKEHGFL